MSDFCTRRFFGRKNKFIESSNLIGIQKNSYSAFLQRYEDVNSRKKEGLEGIFNEVFNFSDTQVKNKVEYLNYKVNMPEYTQEECVRKDLTYSVPVKVNLRVTRYEGKGAERVVKEIKEQEVFFADIPLMTDNGAFIVNGSYRVIISQLQKSAGVFFDEEEFKTGLKKIYAAHIVPYRGAWLDFEVDHKGLCYVRIDKKKKLLLSTFLMLLNLENSKELFSKEEIYKMFYKTIAYTRCKHGWQFEFNEERWKNSQAFCDIADAETGQVLISAGDKLTPRRMKQLVDKKVCYKTLLNTFYLAHDIVDANGSVVFKIGEEINQENEEDLIKFNEVKFLDIDHSKYGSSLRDTLVIDKNNTLEDALLSFYKVMRPGEVASIDGAVNLFKSMFFDFARYDLSLVGRMKMKQRLMNFYEEGEAETDSRVLRRVDLIAIIKGLIAIKDGHEGVDDIDHLGFRRVRSAGELVSNVCRNAMSKVARSLKERLNLVDAEDGIDLHELVNSKVLAAAIREFFGTSPLSQIMDNINGLAEVSHKRRVTAMGPGGLDSLRATFDVRDVHTTHYGRICAVETPEGQNIGLINYLAMYAKIDEFGFIKTPYKKVVDSVITEEIVYLNAKEEEEFAIASYCISVDKNNKIQDRTVSCRHHDEYVTLEPSKVEYIDIASGQILSVAASLIPFIENDDPGRALMGSNMQRQALPLKKPEAPLIGTGVEKQIGKDSMTCIFANYDGKIIYVDSSKIVVQRKDAADKIDTYFLKKFNRSNSYSCIDHTVIVNNGDIVKEGQLLADGATTQQGEIALGRNLRVAFLSFNGYTFEDSIIISDRLLNDRLTSIKVEELTVSIKDTEDIVPTIPGVSEEFLKSLDETGIVYLGAKVKPGDVLVGRVIPKIEAPLSPEERLLKAMFGEKAVGVTDASLRVPPGCAGTVVDVQVFSKKGQGRDERVLMIERLEMQKLLKNKEVELRSLNNNYKEIIANILLNEIMIETSDMFVKDMSLTSEFIERIDIEDLLDATVSDEDKMQNLATIKLEVKHAKKVILDKFDKQIKRLKAGDNLPPGIMKRIKIFVAMNRVIEAGDKIAGRHGNKGIISRVIPVENMPFDSNGQPVDIVLNPLGIAARMNIGQVLETHLGWVSVEIGKQVSKMLGQVYNSGGEKLKDLRVLMKKVYASEPENIDKLNDKELVESAVKISKGLPFAVPSFDGPSMEAVKQLLIDWNLPETGQIKLRDGTTGEYYDRPVTVGYMYMNKLNHMVKDKFHARSTGSYSLITQQPPGGRGRMGGQRKGEMEIWALQAYGAAYITRESMTIKSDDHAGRVAAYEAITQGYEVTNEGFSTPEAFKILQSEMRCICINLECIVKNNEYEEDFEWIPANTNAQFDALRVSILSPDQIRKMSFGEIQKSETINYRTQKAEIGGLHCPAIFGPEKDYKCACERYNKMKYRGTVCEKCGVEVTLSRVRRERMGHIELASPVAHIWFSKVLPSRIGMMLSLSSKDLDQILRFERYLVVKAGITPLQKGEILNQESYDEAKQMYGSDAFVVMIGAEAIEAALKNVNLEEERASLSEELKNKPAELKRKKLIKKLNLIKGFIKTKSRPEWMVLRTLPVMPADLRPLVALDAGRFATSDVNELYRKIINGNNRLKELEACNFPEIVIRNEKRMLQNSVDGLIDNSRLYKPFTGSNGRPLQSIGDVLKGKQGRFRQNLLGKRVDYSGRSVITVGPNLKLHQCGLPKKMALELFKPFVYARLEQYGYATTLRSAKRIVEEQRPEVWEILKEVTYQHPVLLNRPPTLHRLGIQAFECVLVDSIAIQLHPLVCSAFNADFDGDQMAVHLPLSVPAQIEAFVLMLSTNNMISPANGKPIMPPKKDMVLGLYHLTTQLAGVKGEGKTIAQHEIEKALHGDVVNVNAEIHTLIHCHIKGPHMIKTTPGRVVLYNSLPESHKVAFEEVNKLMNGAQASTLFGRVYETATRQDSIEFADVFMELGFRYATKSAISLGFGDIIVPDSKKKMVEKTKEAIVEYQKQFNEGLITELERKNQVREAWHRCDETIGKDMESALSARTPGKDLNALYMMYHSGSRGSTAQMRQLMSMRGFVARTSGEFLENALDRNYAEGLDSHSYYLATHGTRKGFSDMALKTADAGYFTRKLVDVCQDCIITSKDCEENKTVSSKDLRDSLVGFQDRFIAYEAVIKDGVFDFTGAWGRVLAQDVENPEGGLLFEKGTIILNDEVKALSDNSVLSIKIRSPITCANEFGICAKCYGIDLSKTKMVCLGEAVGVIAAQSIGEPGAQLTMRTFHSGGGATHTSSESSIKAVCDGVVKFRNAKFITKEDGSVIMLSRYSECTVIDKFDRERAQYRIPYGAKILMHEGQQVKQNDVICEWDPYVIPRLAHFQATVKYEDLIDGITFKQVLDESTGLTARIVSDWKKNTTKKSTFNPSVHFYDDNGEVILDSDNSPLVYKLDVDDVVMVEDGKKVDVGDLIVKKQRVLARSGDITTGLPRLIEMFEARSPKIQAVISETDGIVSYGKDYRFKKCIIIAPFDGSESKDYMVSKEMNLLVQPGDPVRKGDALCDGIISLHDILRVLGTEAVAIHLLQGIKEIFNSQGMVVDNKHVECIIRYMMRKVEITSVGDSEYIIGEHIEHTDFIKNLESNKGEMPIARPILQGIVRAASTDASFIKSASFQEAHKVFVEASLKGQVDDLRGMKQRLITGQLIPAGTGFVLQQWTKEYFKNKAAEEKNIQSEES